MRRTRQDLQPSLFPDDVFPLCTPQAKTAAQTDIHPSVTFFAADPQAADHRTAERPTSKSRPNPSRTTAPQTDPHRRVAVSGIFQPEAAAEIREEFPGMDKDLANKEISGETNQDVSADKAEARYKFKPQADTRTEAEVGIPTEAGLSADTTTEGYPTRDFGDLFERLSRSGFRSSFHLSPRDRDYFQSKGPATIRHHTEDFILHRLAPAQIPNDGRQTPMRGHPVFTAQHATACCCRECFAKWHHIPAHRPLTPDEQRYAVDVIMTWLLHEIKPR